MCCAADEVMLSWRRHAVLRNEPGFSSPDAGHGNEPKFSAANFVPGSGGGFIGFTHRRDSFSFASSRSFSTGE